MAISVYIVDDEAHIREELSYMLSFHKEIEVAGEADNAFDAIAMIQNSPPDAVFLDIRLGEVDGLTLARKIHKTQPYVKIVFVTALDNHAVESFELDAVDYILKPVSEDRLSKSVERLLANRTSKLERLAPISSTNAIAVKHNRAWKLVDLDDIYFFQTQEHSTTAHTKTDAFQLNYTLRELEEQLGPKRFLRIHKSFILNLGYINEIIPWFNYTYKVTLKDKPGELIVSRSYVKGFKARLKI